MPEQPQTHGPEPDDITAHELDLDELDVVPGGTNQCVGNVPVACGNANGY